MSPILHVGLATAAFVGTHIALSHPLRAGLVARLGERRFAGLYTLVALVTFGWMIWAWPSPNESPPLWLAPTWWLPVASFLILLALILLIGGLRGNPAMPRLGAPPRPIGPARGVYAITRHPMNNSFMLWALVHISISGSARNLIVAGGIFLLGLAGSLGQDRKKEKLLGDSWHDWEARTSFVPFVALLQGRARWRDAMPGAVPLLVGLVLWAAITSWHAPLVSPLGDLLRF
jgi:uncharacterized membrane protein